MLISLDIGGVVVVDVDSVGVGGVGHALDVVIDIMVEAIDVVADLCSL